MKIYTGYYGNMKAYRGMTCIGISLGVPKWLTVAIPNCRQLNPASWMLSMERAPYTEAYNKLLSRLKPLDIVSYLAKVSDDKDVVLLCFEKPGDFCHRELVAAWLNHEAGLDVCEYFKPVEPKKPEPQQMELF